MERNAALTVELTSPGKYKVNDVHCTRHEGVYEDWRCSSTHSTSPLMEVNDQPHAPVGLRLGNNRGVHLVGG